MRLVALLAVFLVAACAGGSGAVTTSPTPSPVVSALPSPSPSAEPTPSPSASPSVVPPVKVTVAAAGKTLSCRLPVTWDIQVDDYTQLHKSGFLMFPTGKLAEDASAPKNAWFYDRPFSKWLPVGRTSVSPDGKRYAYIEGNAMSGDTKGKVHVVDVASGADKVLYSGSPIYGVVDFSAEGIYLTTAPGEVRGRGLWVLNPAGGTPRLITRSIEAPFVGGGAAWGFAFNAADPHPSLGGIEGPVNEVLRVDLATGASTVWLYRPGANLEALGFDQRGHPFIRAYYDQGKAAELWRLDSSAAPTRLSEPGGDTGPRAEAAVDRYGVWFTGGYNPPEVVWLYANGVFRAVATADALSFDVAGGCIP